VPTRRVANQSSSIAGWPDAHSQLRLQEDQPVPIHSTQPQLSNAHICLLGAPSLLHQPKRRNMTLVTVCIPTYNRQSYLREALDSVLAQTFHDFEVLVSDNGSVDGTEELVRSYSNVDRRIRYERLAHNYGLAHNFRRVLSRPSTKFVAYLPDDDLWCPHHLETAVSALEDNASATLYGCTAAFFGNDTYGGRFHRPSWAMRPGQSRYCLDTSRQFCLFLQENPIAPVSVLFRRVAHSNVRWYRDDTFAPMDWMLWGQIALRGSFIFDSEVGVRLRWHSGNLSHSLLTGKRANAQRRYVVRRLAALALEAGALRPDDLVEEVLQSWPVGSAANLVLALASLDSPNALRDAAKAIFLRSPDIQTSMKHCRMAGQVGVWYLGWSDVIDRALSKWWCPSPAPEESPS